MTPLLADATIMTKMTLVQDLTFIMLAAGIIAALFQYLGWPKVIGYILAGIVIGLPFLKPFLIADENSINVLANLGVIFLMFNLGLDLNIGKLKKLGGTCLPAALLDIGMMMLIGFFLGRHYFEWRLVPCIFLGAVLCDSSTTLLAKSLKEMGCLRQKFASVIFGITITEDIITIGLMAILSGLALTGKFQTAELFIQLGWLFLFLAGVVVFGFALLPRLLERLGRMKDDETLLIIVLGICLGLSYVAELQQYSLALGAFLVGAIVSKSPVAQRMQKNFVGLRNMFSAIFFLTIGLMVNLSQILQNWLAILVVVLAVLVGKTLNNTLVSYLCGQPHKESISIGVGLAQLGDFSYLVALMGITLNNGEEPYPQMYQIAVGVSIITTVLNPFLLKATIPFGKWLDARLPKHTLQNLERYTNWAQNTGRQIQNTPRGWQDLRRTFLLYILDMVLVIALFAVAHFLDERRPIWYAMPRFLAANHSTILWGVCLLLCLPLLIAVYIRAEKMGTVLADITVVQKFSNLQAQEGKENSSPSLMDRIKPPLHRLTKLLTAGVFLALTVVEIVLASNIFFLKQTPYTLLMFVAMFLLAIPLRKKITNSLQQSQEDLSRIMDDTEPLEDTEEENGASSQRLTFTIGSESCAIGKKLSELRLRNRTGAIIMSIRRAGGTHLPYPGPNDILLEGDELVLSCSREQYEKTRDLLNRKELPPELTIPDIMDFHTEVAVIPNNSPACNLPLKQLRLRNRTGASIVAIQTVQGQSLSNPGGEDILHANDRVTLLGNSRQIRLAKELLSSPGKIHPPRQLELF